MVVSASTNQLWTKITIGSHAHIFCHSESDTSSVQHYGLSTMSKWKTPWRDPKFFYSFWGVFQDIFHLKGQLTKFVTSEAVKALGVFIGVFSCDIVSKEKHGSFGKVSDLIRLIL